MTPEHLAINLAYNLNSLIMWSFIFHSYYNSLKLQRNMEIVLLILHVRNLIRVWDFEKTRTHFEDEFFFLYLGIS
jgi:hypothetical protein